jgi:hypothetical protein
MASLYEILANAQQGEAMAGLGREFGLTPQQTQAAVESLLPAISMGLKQSTATPEGLGDLFAVMGQQRDLYAMYDDPRAALSPQPLRPRRNRGADWLTSCGRYSDRAHLGRPVRRPVPHPPDLLPRQRMGGVSAIS